MNDSTPSLVHKHRLIALSDLAQGRLRPPPALVDGLLLDRTITQVSSPPYTGKSLLLAAIMLSLDSGLPLLNRFPIPKRKSTLFLGSDAPTWDYAQVAVKLIRGLGLTPEETPKLQSHVLYNSGWKLTSLEVRQHLKALHGEIGFGVLMLDTFRRFHPLNQNDDRDMASFMELLKGIRDELNIAIIFANHERKPSESTRGADPNYSARGSTEISAAVDFNLVLQKRSGTIRLHLPKGRGASPDDLDHTDFKITYGGTPDAPSVALVPLAWSAHSDGHEPVLRALQALGTASRAQLIAALQSDGTTRPARSVDTAIAWATRNKRIESCGRGQWRIVGGT